MAEQAQFQGRIDRTVPRSEPWFAEPPHPGEDAPNVVIVLLDDTGFAQFGCYGSSIETPNVDALAAAGLKFTNFHVTPLCSPTRASLLTGRASHAVGMRSLANFQTGFPNQTGHISHHAATVAEVLHDAGYATFAAGKWHLAPMEQCSAAGPFDNWPLARGFDRFYGFLEGETDQFHPELVADNHPITPPGTPETGYHLSADLVDQTISMIADSKGVRPDRPFFAYLAFGATHAPHQAPAEYLAKYRGAFDEGWEVARDRWFQRQLDMGLLPAGTQLAPRNPGVDPWAELPENQQRLAARLQEAFAAFLDHTDAQIGRLVDGLHRLGQLDNTILMVMADNGASQEGGPFGVLHEMKFFNGILETPDEAVERLDDIGGPHSHANYPWGWAQAGNTPFKWYKQNTHEGGVHVPLVMHWPDGLAATQRGTLRDQFTYVADVVPTIYEVLNIEPPDVRNGLDQLPVTGHSFAAALADVAAPAANVLQYFEMNGSRALVDGDWKAVCKHLAGADYDTEPWELYHIAADRSECHDLAAAEPERLRQLIDKWWVEAERHGGAAARRPAGGALRRALPAPLPAPTRPALRVPAPMSPMPGQASAPIGGRSFDLTAKVTMGVDDEGVLFATGTENSGLSVFVQGHRLVLDYNAFGDHTVLESSVEVPAGDVELAVKLRRGDDRTGTAPLAVDGVEAAQAELPLFMQMMSSIGPSVGFDHGSAVSPRYAAPFPFSGTLHEVVIQASPDRVGDTADTAARAEMSRQ